MTKGTIEIVNYRKMLVVDRRGKALLAYRLEAIAEEAEFREGDVASYREVDGWEGERAMVTDRHGVGHLACLELHVAARTIPEIAEALGISEEDAAVAILN